MPPERPSVSTGNRADDQRGMEGTRASGPDDKMVALRAYRRAKGLCHTCGEKWSQEYWCEPTVPLHIVQELWELIQEPTLEAAPSEDESLHREEVLSVSVAAMNGAETPKIVRLKGSVQGLDVTILIDSRSTHSFVGEALANKLQGEQKPQA